ncbi:tripartite motif-containing protein 16-like [Sinocyclocheilus grahami]|uniref:tripartite motif-containing protein 16-like n=1 Tax=Sinocyclocheilus grahami TaxID=75366 RepID=UPI0007AC76E6|nr:PREDICTED: tripartite motif-containing protein 16-like [Sinocyclocheilus grahami]
MASDKVLLLNSLKDLRETELKEFQWHLKNDHESISESEMEKADRLKTVDKMVECFGPEEALRITVKILKKINQNNLAVELENKHKQGQAEDRSEDPAPVIAESKPTEVTFPNTDPRTRNYFLQYSHQLTLDLNTVNEYLHLSENNRVITGATTELQSYPDHPDRFDHWRQVLCRESVCGRGYWEIERSGDYVCISVSYKSISRKGRGDECEFGSNDQSWSLFCCPDKYSFRHNNTETDLPVKSHSCRRIGVFVDHSAGTLCFYSVSDTMSLIHTVQTTFTQPLYPGFAVYGYKSSMKLC